MNKRVQRGCVALAMSAMVVLAACGDDKSADNNSASTSTVAAASSSTGSSTATSAAGTPESSVPDSSGATQPLPTGDAPATVTIAAGGTQAFLAYASHLAARGSNMFAPVEERFHTKIEFMDGGAGGDMIALLAGGKADGLLVGIGPHAAATTGGVKMTGVVQLLERGSLVLVGAKKYEQDRGTDISKYSDATWGYTSPGANSELISKLASGNAGLKWDNLTTIAFGQTSAGMEGVRTGRLDIVAVDTSTAGRMIDQGIGYLVWKDQPQVFGAYLAMADGFIEKYPELTQAIVDVYLEARKKVEAVGNDPQEILAMFPEEYRKALEPGLQYAWPITRPLLTADAEFTPARLDETVTFLTDHELLDPSRAEAFRASFTNKFVEASHVGK